MPRFEIDVDPCDHITADAIGKPGQRVFYIQAFQDQRTITVIIEKAQLQSLAIGVERFLAQVRRTCAACGIDYVPINTKMPLDAVLSAYLVFREKTLRGARKR